jgi:hypothetical protein
MKIRSGLALLSLVLLLSAPASFAQEDATGPSAVEWRRVSITVDPLLAFVNKWQVTAEFRPAAHWSVAALAATTVGTELWAQSPSWEIGGQWRWYPAKVASLEPHLLAEVVGGRTRWETWSPRDESTDLSASLGGGYKYVARAGFTLEAQVGATLLGHLYRLEEDYMEATLYANLGVGWSF